MLYCYMYYYMYCMNYLDCENQLFPIAQLINKWKNQYIELFYKLNWYYFNREKMFSSFFFSTCFTFLITILSVCFNGHFLFLQS